MVVDSKYKLGIKWMILRTIDGKPIEAEGGSFMHREDGMITLNADFRHRGA